MTAANRQAWAEAYRALSPHDAAAMRTLRSQLVPFRQVGLNSGADRNTLVNPRKPGQHIQFGYRTQKQLLARIHHLQVTTAVRGMAGPTTDCRFDLRICGNHRTRHWWKPVGPGSQDTDGLTTGLTGPALNALISTVYLASCALFWAASTGRWYICIEPYAGHHLRLLMPPLTYTNTLTPAEAATVAAALHEITAAVVN